MYQLLLRAFLVLCVTSGLGVAAQADPRRADVPATADAPKAEDSKYYKRMPSDITLGADDAPITMIEYSSLSCPHCAHFQKDVFPAIQENYVKTGKVLFIHRNFPLDEPALRAAMLVHCAGNDRYYTFIKVLFEKQDSWAYQKNYLEILSNIGKLGGISGDKFDSCMKNKFTENTILEQKLQAASKMGITSTPTFFINGKQYNGANNVAFFEKIFAKELGGSETK